MSCCLSRIDGVRLGLANAVTDQIVTIREVDTANPTGSTDDTVMLFDGATTQFGSTDVDITRVDSATLGTTITLNTTGVYAALFYVPLAAGFNIHAGITMNAPEAIRQGNFEPFDASCFTSGFVFQSLLFSALANGPGIVVITQTIIDADENVLRAQISNVADAPPLAAAFVDALNVVLRISRIGDASG